MRISWMSAFCLFLVTAVRIAGAADVGFVLDLKGKWIVDGPNPAAILIGQALPASAKITAAEIQPVSRITVVLLDGKTIARDCSVKDQCLNPILLPAAFQQETSSWSRLVKAIASVFEHEPTRYQPMISRSTQSLNDCVVALGSGGVDLAPAFRQMKAGTYKVSLLSLEPAKSQKTRITYSWDPGAPSVVEVADLKPGLYKVTASSAAGSTEAWCLFSDPENFPILDAEFRSAIGITESWGVSPNSPAIKSFLRACLQHLQDSSS